MTLYPDYSVSYSLFENGGLNCFDKFMPTVAKIACCKKWSNEEYMYSKVVSQRKDPVVYNHRS